MHRCSTSQRKTRVLCGSEIRLSPAIKGEFTRLDHYSYTISQSKTHENREAPFLHSFKTISCLIKNMPIRFLPLAADNLFGTIVESELCKFALILGRGRNAREIFIARCSIARGNQLLRGREYCRRSGVLLARGVRRRSSFRTVPGIESIAGVDRYHLSTDATCPSPLP